MYKYNQSFDSVRMILEDRSCGICPIATDPQVALNILADYLIGGDQYIPKLLTTEQFNSFIVECLLKKYSNQWKKDWKHYKKTNKKVN